MHRAVAVALLAGLGVAITGCEQAKSANPLSPSVAGPIPGVNITAPQTLEPATGAEVVQGGEPVTLLIENPTTNGERPIWISIVLASDGAFQQVLHQADRVTPGEGGRTSYRIPALLGAGYTYPSGKGHVTLEFSNTTPLPAKIYAGEGCAQVLFIEGDEICETSYRDRGGKYQGQTGVTLPKA